MRKLKNVDLHETLKAVARTPGEYRRDTALLLQSLDRIDAIKTELKSTLSIPSQGVNAK